MTLLSILANNASAVPLAPAFPPGELRYILDHSQALMLISSARFSDRAQETLRDGLEQVPISVTTEKIVQGGRSDEIPALEDVGNAAEKSGMMLYTSGTTNRPVCTDIRRNLITSFG